MYVVRDVTGRVQRDGLAAGRGFGRAAAAAAAAARLQGVVHPAEEKPGEEPTKVIKVTKV